MPVIDEVANDYLDEVSFVAVAGRAPLDRTAAGAAELFSDNLMWGLDESIWELYGVFGQPYSVMISRQGRIVDQWFGAAGESELRERLDALVAIGA